MSTIARTSASMVGEAGDDPTIDSVQPNTGTAQPNGEMACGGTIAIHGEIGVAEAGQMGGESLYEGREVAWLHETRPAWSVQNRMWHDYPPVVFMHPGEDCSYAECLRLGEALTRSWK